MAITFRAGDNGASNSVSPLVLNKPAGTVDGDIIIISFANDSEVEATLPTGFTQVYNQTHPSDTFLSTVWYRVASSEPATYTISGYSGPSKATIETYYDSVGGGSWVVGAALSSTGNPSVSVGPLTTVNNCFILFQGGCDSQSTVSTAPVGMTLATSSIAGVSVAMNTYYESIATAGTETRSITYSIDSSTAGMFYISYGVAGPSVTQADTTPEDGVLQSFTTTGLTGTITAASLGGKDILSLLSNTDPTTATTYTLDVSATTTSIGQPRVGEDSTLSVTATGGTATQTVVIQPKTTWTRVVLAGTIDRTVSGFIHSLEADLGVTTAVGDIIPYSNARGEAITATGVYTGGTTIAYQSTAFVFQDVTGASATVTATSEGDAFYPFGEAPGGGGVPKTKFRRFPWQAYNKL